MAKTRNPKVVVAPNAEEPNPYKKGTFKRILMQWALDKGEFTKDEFLEAHDALKQEHKHEGIAGGKAWWNEFYNKHEVFVDAK